MQAMSGRRPMLQACLTFIAIILYPTGAFQVNDELSNKIARMKADLARLDDLQTPMSKRIIKYKLKIAKSENDISELATFSFDSELSSRGKKSFAGDDAGAKTAIVTQYFAAKQRTQCLLAELRREESLLADLRKQISRGSAEEKKQEVEVPLVNNREQVGLDEYIPKQFRKKDEMISLNVDSSRKISATVHHDVQQDKQQSRKDQEHVKVQKQVRATSLHVPRRMAESETDAASWKEPNAYGNEVKTSPVGAVKSFGKVMPAIQEPSKAKKQKIRHPLQERLPLTEYASWSNHAKFNLYKFWKGPSAGKAGEGSGGESRHLESFQFHYLTCLLERNLPSPKESKEQTAAPSVCGETHQIRPAEGEEERGERDEGERGGGGGGGGEERGAKEEGGERGEERRGEEERREGEEERGRGKGVEIGRATVKVELTCNTQQPASPDQRQRATRKEKRSSEEGARTQELREGGGEEEGRTGYQGAGLQELGEGRGKAERRNASQQWAGKFVQHGATEGRKSRKGERNVAKGFQSLSDGHHRIDWPRINPSVLVEEEEEEIGADGGGEVKLPGRIRSEGKWEKGGREKLCRFNTSSWPPRGQRRSEEGGGAEVLWKRGKGKGEEGAGQDNNGLVETGRANVTLSSSDVADAAGGKRHSDPPKNLQKMLGKVVRSFIKPDKGKSDRKPKQLNQTRHFDNNQTRQVDENQTRLIDNNQTIQVEKKKVLQDVQERKNQLDDQNFEIEKSLQDGKQSHGNVTFGGLDTEIKKDLSTLDRNTTLIRQTMQETSSHSSSWIENKRVADVMYNMTSSSNICLESNATSQTSIQVPLDVKSGVIGEESKLQRDIEEVLLQSRLLETLINSSAKFPANTTEMSWFNLIDNLTHHRKQSQVTATSQELAVNVTNMVKVRSAVEEAGESNCSLATGTHLPQGQGTFEKRHEQSERRLFFRHIISTRKRNRSDSLRPKSLQAAAADGEEGLQAALRFRPTPLLNVSSPMEAQANFKDVRKRIESEKIREKEQILEESRSKQKHGMAQVKKALIAVLL
eukprot:768296-Hanusia_phi.AAC.3